MGVDTILPPEPGAGEPLQHPPARNRGG